MAVHCPLTQLYINGKFVSASDNSTFDVRNPYSGDVVTISSSASSADCTNAIEAAAAAFSTWEQTSLTLRRDIFLRAADLATSAKYKERIMRSTMEETGAAGYMGQFNSSAAANNLRVYAGMVDLLRGETYPSASVPGAQVIVQPRAMGVVFAISPWNAPFHLSIRAIATPIIAGNTIVLKGSELSPRSQAIVAELFEEAGLPAGVLNFLSMSKETTPELTAQIIAHPQVRCINFTGSDRVGKIIAMQAAKYLKPCVLELGGKSPSIILNDADLEAAARAVVSSSMSNSGQVCMATSRVIVQKGVADTFIEKIRELTKKLKAGDVEHDPSVQLGALFSQTSAENAVAMIVDAQSNGAEVILGDVNHTGGVIQPHLVKNVKPGTVLWDKEVFGPVLAIAVAETVDEAVELANASEYSLSASIWTKDVHEGQGIASRIHSGYANINGPTFHSEPHDSLVGLGGASGYGRFHIDNFTVRRVTVIHPYGRELFLVK